MSYVSIWTTSDSAAADSGVQPSTEQQRVFAKSLEAELDQIIADNKKLLEDTDKNTRDISTIYGRLKNVYQKMAIVKYDAYEQLGGEMSAVVVILDEKNNGVLINNVYSTEGGYVYTREIENGKCKHELGAEEQQALTEAIHK